jgi:hypothetical protein
MSAPVRPVHEPGACHHPDWCDPRIYSFGGHQVRHAGTPVVIESDDDATIAVRLERDDELLFASGDWLPHEVGVALYVDNEGIDERSQAYFELDGLDRLIAVLQDHRQRLIAAMQAEKPR